MSSTESFSLENYEELEDLILEPQFHSITSIKDYKFIDQDCTKLEIAYINNDMAKQYFKPKQFESLKIKVYYSKQSQFGDLTTFLENFLNNQEIQHLDINLCDYKNMNDNHLKLLQDCLQGQKDKFVSLSINLNNWGLDNPAITKQGCKYLGKIFKNQKNIENCQLLCSKWGYNNRNINNDAIQELMKGIKQLSNLKQLELDLQSWGCQKFSSLGIITDKGTEYLAKCLQNLKKLEKFKLNLRSWGYQNKDISNNSLQALGNALNKMNNLEQLHLNLYCWGYENNRISGTGILSILNSLDNHHNLEDIDINFSGWGLDQKQSRNLINISNDTVKGMFDHFQKYKKLKNFSINLNQWGWKNNTISNNSLKSIGNFLQERGENLNSLELSLKMWYNHVDKINQGGIESLSNGLQKCHNLKKLYLNLECMGFKNRNIDNNCIKQIVEPLYNMQQLEELHLLLECWGVEDERNFDIVCDQDIKNIMEPIQQMSHLKILNINFDSWGYKNRRITDKSVKAISKCIQNLSRNLISLDLHLKNWGYYNQQIKNSSIKSLSKMMNSLQNLQNLNLDIENWGEGNELISLNSLQNLANQIYKLPNLMNFNLNHNIQDWNDSVKQIEENQEYTQEYKFLSFLLKNLNNKLSQNKNVILSHTALNQIYSHVYRKELINDIVEILIL